ncbi:MAG TPA: CinA family protein [Sporichthyaceae bacterium]|jgi:PncC family amidohydrolase
MLPPALTEPAVTIAARLRARGETLAVAESAAGGLISAALLAVPGASAYFRGGVVIYTLDGAKELLAGGPPPAAGVRGASEPFARWLAASAAGKLAADWGIGETGAAGPSGNPYGDPAGHDWVAVHPPDGRTCARHLLTGSDDRAQNMQSFAAAGLALLLEILS